MSPDGNGIRARAETAVDAVVAPLTSVAGGAGLTLLALGVGSLVLTFPALSLTQATLVAVGGWLAVRNVAATDDARARATAPSAAHCIDCGRAVVTDRDGPVRCLDCADPHGDATGEPTEQATTDTTAADATTDADTSAAESGEPEATAAEEDAAEQGCVRCGAAEAPLSRVRLLNGEDYDYCPDCRAEAEASDVVHAVAMTEEEACAVLGISPEADDDAVRAAFRHRVKVVHPDRDGDREAFDRVRAAYERIQD